jgi:YD repeat-containing protein
MWHTVRRPGRLLELLLVVLVAGLWQPAQAVQPIPARTCTAYYVYFQEWTLRCSPQEAAEAYVAAHNAQPLAPPYQCGSGANAAYPVTYPGVVVTALERSAGFSWRPQHCGPPESTYVTQGPMGWDTRTLPAMCPDNSAAINGQCVCSAGYAPNQVDTACVPPVIEERSCKTANPVQPGSGRKRFEHTDYAGAGAHPLTLTRHYNSRWTNGAPVDGYARIPTWGGGWRHSYQALLTLGTDGTLRAFRSDGSMQSLLPSQTTANAWTAAGSRDAVTAIVDGTGQRTGFTYAAAEDDSTETYDASGKLQSIKARNGWLTTLSYSDGTTPSSIAPRPGLLISVKNQFGREMKFTYDSQGRIAELLPPSAISGQPAGSANSPIRYRYNEAGSIGTNVFAYGQLTSITWQDGAVRRYHHEDARWPHAVTGITDEAGVRYGTYAYDSEGRVSRSELAGGAERLEFAYGADATTGKPTTTVTDYNTGTATSRSYTFTDVGGIRYPLSVSAPCDLCGSTQQASSYDANGSPVKTIAHEGTVTFYVYDAKGRETERATFPSSYQTATTRPALNAATRVVSTKWHATWMLPTQVAEPNKTTANTYNSKGMLTGTSWTATTDATGAAKFSAVKTGDTRSLGWSYNASSLNTTKIERINATEIARWTYAYDAKGVPIKLTDKDGKFTRVTAVDVHGRPTAGVANNNEAIYSTQYDLRGNMTKHSIGSDYATWRYGPMGKLVEMTTSAGMRAELTYTPLGQLERMVADGRTVYPAPAIAAQVITGKATVAESATVAAAATPAAAAQSADQSSSNVWLGAEAGVTGNLFVGGVALNTGVMTNASTRETCPYVSMCFRAALGLLGSAGGKLGAQNGPRCGKDWTNAGTQVQAVGDVVTPVGGVGASIGVGDRSLTGLGVGVGPGWGLGAAVGLEFCWIYVNPQACTNTPCDCKGGSK